MDFLFSGLLTIGLPLVGLPVLIHLINLMRHKKIDWAAMEFLLASQKKNSTWVLIKQLLLLLMRMAAVAAIAFMVAQPLLKDRLGRFLGGNKVQHILLLDDSFSMADSWGNTTAFEEAKKAIKNILAQEDRRGNDQEAIILRFSQAAVKGKSRQPDLDARLNGKIAEQFPAIDRLKPSDLATGPAESLDAVVDLVREQDKNYAVYVISDYRSKDWRETAAMEQRISTLNDLGVVPKFVSVVNEARPNLSLAALRPLPGARVEKVPLTVEIAVTNHGAQQVVNIPVTIMLDDKKPGFVEQFDKIDSGKTALRTFEITIPKPGLHTLTARLEKLKPTDDTLEPDNQFQTVLEILPAAKVLLIEGTKVDSQNANLVDSFYLIRALSMKQTGYEAEVQPRSFLRNPKLKLSDYHAVFILNVKSFDEGELKILEAYARGGGGVSFFLGDEVDPKYYEQKLYSGGAGIFPVPLVGATELPPTTKDEPDVRIIPHEIFYSLVQNASLSGGDSVKTDIGAVLVQRYFAVQRGWTPSPKSTAKVLATLRNGAPLIVESRFGEGRVVAFLTAASPAMTDNDPKSVWNNWGRLFWTFPITLNETLGYLAMWKQTDPSRPVGAPLIWESEPVENLLDDAEIETPYEGALAKSKLKLDKTKAKWNITYDETNKAGLYFLGLENNSGIRAVTAYPFNVDPREGQMNVTNGGVLHEQMPRVEFDFIDYLDQQSSQALSSDMDKNNISIWILYLLIALLLGEQLLAYSASYHTAAREAVAR